MKYYDLKVKKEVMEEYLRTVKRLSGVEDDLERGLEYAVYFATSEELEIINFLKRLLMELASGRIELSFDIFGLYRSVAP